MHDTIADKFCILKARNHLKDPFLLAPLEMSLEANDVVKTARCIILTKLHHSVWRLIFTISRALIVIWIFQTNWLHRSIKHSFNPSLSHDFNRHAAFKVFFFFKGIERCFLSIDQSIMEIHKFLLSHRCIEIGCFPLIIAGFEIDLGHINGIDIDDWRCCVVEIKTVTSIERVDFFC